jgi:predicted glycogen debranching enzyme
MTPQTSQEWLEADGLGGFASGTAAGIRTRRYHALLLTAATPPAGRLVLVNGFDAWIETPAGWFALSSQNYAPGVIAPEGAEHIAQFSADPWPRWIYHTNDGTRVEQEICAARDLEMTVVKWRLLTHRAGVRLIVRPFLSGRDYHSLHHENPTFRFDARTAGERVTWHPYESLPAIVAVTNGKYTHEPLWYRNFLYAEERARGLDETEDLATPGVFEWDLSTGDAVMLLTTDDSEALVRKRDLSAATFADNVLANERMRRAEFPSRLHRAAGAYIVNGWHGKTIVAGYPWFADWGRDTFIALRGLCLATGRLDDAREILLAWTKSVSEGMLPNRFPDAGQQPEFNSVDASLWFIVAAHELIEACGSNHQLLPAKDKRALQNTIEQILEGYARGTRFGIRLDDDGLLGCGVPGVQLTWMDAKVGDWVVTPRIGKPVEIQALWLNALKIAGKFSRGWEKHFERGLKFFREKFWNEIGGFLYDVIDCNHERGKKDAAFRPNQIFAVGGLPFPLLEGERAQRIVARVEEELLTPLGLRSLAAGEIGYVAHYAGGVRERDGAYHQGTVWPWLIGPFVEAWVRVRGDTAGAKCEAREKFLAPLLAHLDAAGLGHISEIADAAAPHTPRGCPFQAWSVGEALRLDRTVLAETNAAPVQTSEMVSA